MCPAWPSDGGKAIVWRSEPRPSVHASPLPVPGSSLSVSSMGRHALLLYSCSESWEMTRYSSIFSMNSFPACMNSWPSLSYLAGEGLSAQIALRNLLKVVAPFQKLKYHFHFDSSKMSSGSINHFICEWLFSLGTFWPIQESNIEDLLL